MMKNVSDPRVLLHRSGAAARLARLPAATLRVWERRYAIVDPARSAAGQRLYTAEDVARLKILKRLVDRGYAIGTLARCTMGQLEDLLKQSESGQPTAMPTDRLAVVGRMLAQRLERWGLTEGTSFYRDLDSALAELPDAGTDILFVHAPSLRENMIGPMLEFKSRRPSTRIAVVYSYGIAAVLGTLRSAGIHLAREPLNRAQFEQLAAELATRQRKMPGPKTAVAQSAPRMFSEDELLRFERLSASIRCECPQHLVGLIQQTAAFEAYSEECRKESAEDAALHARLAEVAGQARQLFESAVAEVARVEGVSLKAITADESRS